MCVIFNMIVLFQIFMQYYKTRLTIPIFALLVCLIVANYSYGSKNSEGLNVSEYSFIGIGESNVDLSENIFDCLMEDVVSASSRRGYHIKTVVLDAGHGGRDPGCLGAKTKEKDIALSIVLKLGELFRKNSPDIKIIYTRSTDVFIELHERARIANKHKADLFISVHCNAARDPKARGTETFVLGLHRASDNLSVAKRENASILYEDNYEANYEGYDPNSDEGHILLSLFQNAYLEQSIRLAFDIETNFKSNMKLPSRGVKQDGFLVLRNAAMPSVLVEAGFLSNPEDEKFLSTDAGQIKVAENIYNAFVKYKNAVEIDIPKPENISESGDGVYIQLGLVRSDKKEDNTFAKYKLNPTRVIKEDNFFKIQYGPFSDKQAAMDALQRAKQAGVKDAFIIGYRDGKKIKFSEL